MASRTPLAVRNENVPVHRGKGVDSMKADVLKPKKFGNQDRKALRDLSNTGKPPVSTAIKGITVKEKPGIHGRDTSKHAPKSTILTDKEIRNCEEWAKEGTEFIPFTGNDLQKLQRNIEEERVKKKVKKVMSALSGWSSAGYVLGLPKITKDPEEVKLETEPEVVLLPSNNQVLRISGNKEVDSLPESEPDHLPFFNCEFELKMKEESGPDSASLCR